MVVKYLRVVFLLGAVVKSAEIPSTMDPGTAFLTTDGNTPLAYSAASYMPTVSSSTRLTSALSTAEAGSAAPEGTTRETMTAAPTAPPGETNTTPIETTADIVTPGDPTDPPPSPTAGATTPPAEPETNHTTPSETAKPTTAPAPTINTTTAPITTSNNTTNAPATSTHDTATNTPLTTKTANDTMTNTAVTATNNTTHAPITSHETATNATTGSGTTPSTLTPPTNNSPTSVTLSPSTDTTLVTHVTGTASATTQPNNTTPTSTTTSVTSNATAMTTINSDDTPETPASPTTPSSSTTNPSLTTGLPPSSPSSSSLPPITSPGSSNTPPTGITTSLSPSSPTPGVTTPSIETTAANGTTTVSPNSTTPTHEPTVPTTNRSTTVITTLQPTEGTSSTTTLSPLIVCPSVPCPVHSVCLGSACQCLTGSYMTNGRCEAAQVFSGKLHFISLPFVDQMSNRSSSTFQSTAASISAALNNVFKGEIGYIRSDVVQLQKGSVVATVNNIFEHSFATQESVDGAIKQAISSFPDLLKNATYTGTKLCDVEPLPCDASTAMCTNAKGQAVCSCIEGYISMVYSNSSCRACPSGQRAAGDTCQPCPFGYAGFNCRDSSLLAVVVVSCVLGGIFVIAALAVLVYYCWTKCSCRMPSYSTSPYSDDLNKSWPTAIMPIPRASTNWDAATSIEMTEGGNINILEQKKQQSNGISGSYDLDPEDMQTFRGKNSSRYSYLVQGHENPYFLPGEQKKN